MPSKKKNHRSTSAILKWAISWLPIMHRQARKVYFLPHSNSQQQRKLACVLLQSLSKPLSNRDECSWVSFLYLAINHKRKPIGPLHAKRALTTWHVISSNLHLKSSAKNGGSNWVLIQGAIFTVSIVISGLLSLPSCYLENEAAKKA